MQYDSDKNGMLYNTRNEAVPGRQGNDYQTLVLLYYALVNFFDKKQFTLKTEVDDGTNIDDLEIEVDNQVIKYQIKHATNENDYYTPSDLLYVSSTKTTNQEKETGKKNGPSLIHFFEAWCKIKYIDKKTNVLLALYTNYDFNERCLKGLLNVNTRTFNDNFIHGLDLNSVQNKFREDLFNRIRKLNIISHLDEYSQDCYIKEFLSEFKFYLTKPRVEEREKKILELLKKHGLNQYNIYASLFEYFNRWLRERKGNGKQAVIITEKNTEELLINLEFNCKNLQRLICDISSVKFQDIRYILR